MTKLTDLGHWKIGKTYIKFNKTNKIAFTICEPSDLTDEITDESESMAIE